MFAVAFSAFWTNYDAAEGGCYLPQREVYWRGEYATFNAAKDAYKALIQQAKAEGLAIESQRLLKERGKGFTYFSEGYELHLVDTSRAYETERLTRSFRDTYC